MFGIFQTDIDKFNEGIGEAIGWIIGAVPHHTANTLPI